MKNSKQMPSGTFRRLGTALALRSYNFFVNKSTLLDFSVASDVSLLYTTMNAKGGLGKEDTRHQPSIFYKPQVLEEHGIYEQGSPESPR